MRAVWPVRVSVAWTSAPWASRIFSDSTLPFRAAVMTAASPPGSELFGSAPAFSSASIKAALPFRQAAYSGLAPYRLTA